MPKFKVLVGHCSVVGDVYPGDVIEISERDAISPLHFGSIEPVPVEPPVEPVPVASSKKTGAQKEDQ
jgi:hypothetical protein